jgi:hypothetical protein
MDRKRIIQEAKAELERHIWDTFVEGKATVAFGGTGAVVSGCEACRKRLGTNSQYLRHLADDVLPAILRQAFAAEPENMPPEVR